MKFGLKLWSTNTDLINQAIHLIDEKVFDYIELFVVPDSVIDPFEIDIPYIIHITHEKFDVNIGESSKKETTLKHILHSKQWADRLDAKYMILHAGYGSLKDGISFLSDIEDDRLLIENMPKIGIDEQKMIGYTPEQILELISENDFGLCLDFGHAAKAAVSLGLDYKEHILNFMKLKPRMFHISDGLLDTDKDQHLAIGKGGYDMAFIKKCVCKNQYQCATMETPRTNMGSLDEDRENLQMFLSC